MGSNDHFGRWDSTTTQVVCRCGAVYRIYEDEGEPGCRDIETVSCRFCNKELASCYGTCRGDLVSDERVSQELKDVYKEHERAMQDYIALHGHNWGTTEYTLLRTQWLSDINAVLLEKDSTQS